MKMPGEMVVLFSLDLDRKSSERQEKVEVERRLATRQENFLVNAVERIAGTNDLTGLLVVRRGQPVAVTLLSFEP